MAWSSQVRTLFARPDVWVILVAAAYAIAQLLLLHEDRFFEWDEAVYVSEARRGIRPIGFDVHRARGIAWLIAPVAEFTTSIPALRIYLLAISSVAMAGSFLVWSRLVAWGAPVGAGLFAVSWTTVLYGSEVSPNLYVAYAAIATVGVAVCFGREPTTGRLVALAVLVGVATVFRPADAALLAVGAVATTVVVERRVRAPLVASVAAGFSGGLVPWLVEAWVRFDGPLNRLRRAGDFAGSGIRFQLAEHARLLDGPLVGPDTGGEVITGGLWWAGTLGLLGLMGALIAGRDRRAGAAALMTAAWMALPYLFSVRVLAPRFLLPALGLLSVAAGVGIGTVLAARRWAAIVPMAVVIVAGAVWNLSNVVRVEEEQVVARSQSEVLGSLIRERAGGTRCNFLSQFGYPQVELASGCDGRALVAGDPAGPERLQALAAEGRRVFVVSTTDPMLDAGWDCETVVTPGDLSWHLCAR